jgi:hypothetical protein
MSSLRVDFHTFHHVLLMADATVVPEKSEHAFSSGRLSLYVFFLEEVR